MSTTPPPASWDCQTFLDKRESCYRKNGLGEYHRDHDHENKIKYSKCWIPNLRAKRCLAFQHCTREALEYYQTPSDKFIEGVNGPKDKGYCASYDESFCTCQLALVFCLSCLTRSRVLRVTAKRIHFLNLLIVLDYNTSLYVPTNINDEPNL